MVANADSRSYYKKYHRNVGLGSGSPRDLSNPCIRWGAEDHRSVTVLNRCVESGYARGLVTLGELRGFTGLETVTAVGGVSERSAGSAEYGRSWVSKKSNQCGWS